MSRLLVLPLLLLLGCPAPVASDDTGTLPVGPADDDKDGYDVETDCDDNDAANHPGADERCDGVDNDCDGEVDDDPVDIQKWYADLDGDTYGDPSAQRSACEKPSGYVADFTDCNDASADFHPGAPETACDGPDFNCNGLFDEGDADGDGFASCSDCDDTRADVNPDGTESCDGLDNDCDGTIDDGAGDSLTFYADLDGDLYGDADSPVEACALPPGYSETQNDCDDTDPDVHPGSDELCNGQDDNCDGTKDEDPVDPTTFFQDADGDGFGNAAVTVADCSPPAGFGEDSSDCDDSTAMIYPGAPEYCGGTDYDCDGATNEASSVDAAPYYADTDGDGYPGTLSGVACSAPAGYSFSSTDCNERDASVNPAADDGCDDVDNDCDGAIDGGLRVPEDYATIQSAIYAGTSGDLVCVAAGTYSEDLDFAGRGLTVEGEDGSASTWLIGTGTGPVVRIDNYETDAGLKGLTITGGSSASGAGIYALTTRASFEDLVVYDNSCTASGYCYGTGIYGYGDLTFTDVSVQDNWAYPSLSGSYVYAAGAGVHLTGSTIDVRGLTVDNNWLYLSSISGSSSSGSGQGAGLSLESCSGSMSDVTVTDNVIWRDSASTGYGNGYGGGVAMSYSTLAIDDLTVQGNVIELAGTYDYAWGGGLYLSQDASTFDHVDVRANDTDAYATYGAGWTFYYYSASEVTNAFIAGNTASGSYTSYAYGYGGGVCSYYYAEPVLTNVDIVGNKLATDYSYGAGIAIEYYSSISTDNAAVVSNSGGGYSYGGAVYYSSAAAGYSFAYSNFYGNTSSEFSGLSTVVGTSGNVAVAPGYTSTSSADPTAWNFKLTATSSMKNVGDTALTDTDGTRSDIGGYGGPGGGW